MTFQLHQYALAGNSGPISKASLRTEANLLAAMFAEELDGLNRDIDSLRAELKEVDEKKSNIKDAVNDLEQRRRNEEHRLWSRYRSHYEWFDSCDATLTSPQ